jgi:hypothetical protein
MRPADADEIDPDGGLLVVKGDVALIAGVPPDVKPIDGIKLPTQPTATPDVLASFRRVEETSPDGVLRLPALGDLLLPTLACQRCVPESQVIIGSYALPKFQRRQPVGITARRSAPRRERIGLLA